MTASCSSASLRTSPNPRSARAPFLATSGSGIEVASIAREAIMGKTVRGQPTFTSPQPERRALLAAIAAAPVKPVEPARTKSLPKSPLWPSGFLWGSRSKTISGEISSTVRSNLFTTWSGIPMGTTSTWPASSRPGETYRPYFGSANGKV